MHDSLLNFHSVFFRHLVYRLFISIEILGLLSEGYSAYHKSLPVCWHTPVKEHRSISSQSSISPTQHETLPCVLCCCYPPQILQLQKYIMTYKYIHTHFNNGEHYAKYCIWGGGGVQIWLSLLLPLRDQPRDQPSRYIWYDRLTNQMRSKSVRGSES
jgi:hypothetical protein